MADLDITVDGNLTNNTAPATTDRLLLVDDGTTSLQDITLANLLKVVNSLTADGTPDTSADYLLAYDADAGAAKKVLMNLVGTVTATSTTTFTNKRITKRVTTITSHATPTVNTDDCDAVTITAQAEAITSMTTNLSGTPTNFQPLLYRIKDNGTARAITWGASFEAKGVTLPTITVISKVLTVGFIYDTVTSKWGCVASAQET